MVRQHDAAGAYADAAGASCDVTDNQGGSRAGYTRHIVMLRQPIALEAPGFRMPGQIQTVMQGIRHTAAF
ncbi:hypothetical protein D3C81_1893270 [compost metagenome]